MCKKALLFINGVPPKSIPDIYKYDVIVCTDGALHYLKELDFPIQNLDFVSGDFDSFTDEEMMSDGKFIHTPDQDFTDFHKALQLLLDRGIAEVDVLGGSGGEQDHFLGNISVAYHFKKLMKIIFYDEFSRYFFIPKNFSVEGVKGKMISLYPFPYAKNIVSKGVKWCLCGEDLDITKRLGTRNMATDDIISVSYEEGNLLIFIGC
ncbi:thiamine diphosphokinase [Riemerella columbipharyngis]|uniref:Thiamine diphosphokinase n=1 Tax=Riemerella columbipharyngis TaxID=1071918 RepID=A0A1G6ZHY4_9FLAO|nr:thiamine diphosphokinase [Riemerella columbipharyngis]SDE02334.1 thiamine pyrophosphokinase [Riemerella columbipharyngis]